MRRRIYDRNRAPVGPELVEGLGKGETFSCWYAKDRRPTAPRRPRRAHTPPSGQHRQVARRYELHEKLGTGSMGEVWAGVDKRDQREVAVKILRPELVDSCPEAKVRFAREAMVLSKLRSPHVVELYDFGTDGAVPYMAMELVVGIDLKQLLTERGWLTPQEVSILVSDAAQGLDAVHRAGIVHRDLKPSNLVICEVAGERVAKLIDFGIARPPASAMQLTGLRILGTAHYMSPEQCRGRRTVDHRADLWSLAMIAYRALTGYMPFDGAGLQELVETILFGDAPKPSALVPALTCGVDAFFAKALCKNPDGRFADALELAEGLHMVLAPLRSGEFVRPTQLTEPHRGPDRT